MAEQGLEVGTACGQHQTMGFEYLTYRQDKKKIFNVKVIQNYFSCVFSVSHCPGDLVAEFVCYELH